MRTEAPGLTFKLQRIFDESTIDRLANDYRRVVELGGAVEQGITREEGVSYNPRVARIASLMLECCKPPTYEGIAAAMWSLVPQREDCCAEMDPAVAAIIAQLHREPGAVSTVAATVCGVSALDFVRHLHMTALSKPERIAALETIKSDPVLSADFPLPGELRTKVEHAIRLQERNIRGE